MVSEDIISYYYFWIKKAKKFWLVLIATSQQDHTNKINQNILVFSIQGWDKENNILLKPFYGTGVIYFGIGHTYYCQHLHVSVQALNVSLSMRHWKLTMSMSSESVQPPAFGVFHLTLTHPKLGWNLNSQCLITDETMCIDFFALRPSAKSPYHES